MDLRALVAIFATSFGVGFSGAVIPGPLTAYSVREAARHGGRVGALIASGHSLAELGMVFLLLEGFGAILSKHAVSAAVAIAGGVFLVVIGVSAIKGSKREAEAQFAEQAVDAPVHTGANGGPSGLRADVSHLGNRLLEAPIYGGILMSLFSPSWILWWATVGASYVVWALPHGNWGVASFYTGHILSDYVWLGFLSFLVGTGRRWLNPKTFRWLLLFSGAFLLALGAYFFVAGIRFIV
ncbi:MAG: LysE family transporter [Chloroflexi bacterium]|nr:LysE family transporter [Chloroflexota bacterium]